MSALEQLIGTLGTSGLDFDQFSIADVIWAAQHLPILKRMPVELPVAPTTFSPDEPNRVEPQIDVPPAPAPVNTEPLSRPPPPPAAAAASIAVDGPKNGQLFPEPDPNPSGSTIPVSPLRIAAGAAIPAGLDIVRALRALPARRPSRTELELDTEATVDATAENAGRLAAQMRPVNERWFEITIVVELTPSAEMWSDTVVELERLLQYTGVFRDVRVSYLSLAGNPFLISRSGERLPPRAMCDPFGRRVVMLFGTGVSRAWVDGRVGDVVATWSRTNPVVLAHALPESMWRQTRLGRPPAVVDARTVGSPNDLLLRGKAFWARRLRVMLARPALPVIALEPRSVRRWAEMIAMRRGTSAQAFLLRPNSDETIDKLPTFDAFPLNGAVPAPAVQAPGAAAITAGAKPIARGPQALANTVRTIADAEERVKHLAVRSPRAYRMAVLLASAPFSLPLARLVNSAMYGKDGDDTVLAELMLSGLVERLPSDNGGALFRFAESAKSVLRRALRTDEVREFSDYLARHLTDSGALSGEARLYYRDPAGAEALAADTQPLAHLRDSLMQMLGVKNSIVAPRVTAFDPVIMAEELLVGREADLENVDRELRRTNFVTIVGSPGVGKSALARAVARSARDRYDIIWRIDAGTQTCLSASVNALRAALKLPIDTQFREPIEIVTCLLNDVDAIPGRLLLVADDVSFAWMQDIFDAGWQSTASERLGVLLTTRTSRKIPVTVAVHRLASLTAEDASLLLTGGTISRFGASDGDRIIKLIGAMPLALVLATATLRNMSGPSQGYLKRLSARLTDRAAISVIDARTSAALGELVDLADQLTFGARVVFVTICCFGYDFVPRRVLQEQLPFFSPPLRGTAADMDSIQLEAQTIDSALATLGRLGLVQFSSSDGARAPHFVAQLVRDTLYSRRVAWWRLTITRLIDAFYTTGGEENRLELLPLAFYALEQSSQYERKPSDFNGDADSFAERARLAIDCGLLAHQQLQTVAAERFAYHASLSLKILTSIGQIDSVLEFQYDKLRRLVRARRNDVKAISPEPAAEHPNLRKFLKEEELLKIAGSEIGTHDLRMLQLYATRKRQTWLIGGGGSIVAVSDDRVVGEPVVMWSVESLGRHLVQVSPREGLVHIGRSRYIKYSQRMHPHPKELSREIYRLVEIDPLDDTPPAMLRKAAKGKAKQTQR